MKNEKKHDINCDDITIGRLGPERFADFRVLRLESLKAFSEAFGSSYEEESSFSDEVWKARIVNMLFAIYKTSLIGMIGFSPRDRVKTRHVADIFSFYVGETYQGAGVGSKLMEEALLNIKKNREIRKITLSVNCDMEAAVHLYKKFGFAISGRLIRELNINGNFYDEFIMEKLVKTPS